MKVKLLKRFRRDFYITQENKYNGIIIYTGHYKGVRIGYECKELYNKQVFQAFSYRGDDTKSIRLYNATSNLREVDSWYDAIENIKRIGLEMFLYDYGRNINDPNSLKRNKRKNKIKVIYGRGI